MRKPSAVVMSGALMLSATIVATLLYAPYLPRLLNEGYPAAAWPASGTFSDLMGAQPPPHSIPESAKMAQPNPWLLKLLSDSKANAILALHNGRIILEHYGKQVKPTDKFNSYSMAKTLVGALVLKAVAEGRITSLDDAIGTYLPSARDKQLSKTPIRAFLDMRSGILFEQGPPKSRSIGGQKDIEAVRANPLGPMARLHMSGLPSIIGSLTSRKEKNHPFEYQNVNTAILGDMLERIYQRPLQDILSDKVWKPAGAQTAKWRHYNSGGPVTPYCCIYARPRDWLRIGQYILTNGSRSKPFLPKPLWNMLLGKHVPTAMRKVGDYATHLYHNTLDRPGEPLQGNFSYLSGANGQVVYLMPQHNLVVVRFGRSPQLLHSTMYATWRSIANVK